MSVDRGHPVYPDAKKGSIANGVGMLYRFAHEVEIGDYVVFPSKIDRQINIGVVEGGYEYNPSAAEYVQQRKVKWLKHLPRTSFSQGAFDRVKCAGMAKEQGMACIIWDNHYDGIGGECFKIFDRNSCTFTYDRIAGALMDAYGTIYTSPVPSASTDEGFYVSGTKIYDANNKEFAIRGVNVPYAWYKDDFVTAIDGIAAKGANAVRVVLGDGQTYDKTSKQELSFKYCK